MKRVIFIQIGTGVFAVEIDEVKHFVCNVQVSDFGGKGEISNICGLISLDNEVIPVLDVDKWFGQKPMIFSAGTIFVIMMSGSKPFAFPIDDVINSCEVPGECFHALPAVAVQESVRVFREVIECDGTLYPKISAENIGKEMGQRRCGEERDGQ